MITNIKYIFDKAFEKKEVKRLNDILSQEKDNSKIDQLKNQIKMCRLLPRKEYKLLFK